MSEADEEVLNIACSPETMTALKAAMGATGGVMLDTTLSFSLSDYLDFYAMCRALQKELGLPSVSQAALYAVRLAWKVESRKPHPPKPLDGQLTFGGGEVRAGEVVGEVFPADTLGVLGSLENIGLGDSVPAQVLRAQAKAAAEEQRAPYQYPAPDVYLVADANRQLHLMLTDDLAGMPPPPAYKYKDKRKTKKRRGGKNGRNR